MQNHRNSIEIDNNKNQWLQSGISISFVRKSMFDEERKKSTHQHFIDFSNINPVFFLSLMWKKKWFRKSWNFDSRILSSRKKMRKLFTKWHCVHIMPCRLYPIQYTVYRPCKNTYCSWLLPTEENIQRVNLLKKKKIVTFC